MTFAFLCLRVIHISLSLQTYVDFFKLIKTSHVPTLVISAVCLAFLLLVKFLFNDNLWIQSRLPVRIPIPGELVVVSVLLNHPTETSCLSTAFR